MEQKNHPIILNSVRHNQELTYWQPYVKIAMHRRSVRVVEGGGLENR